MKGSRAKQPGTVRFGDLMARTLKSQTAIQQLRYACQAKGLKATRQRLEILKIVSQARNHPSAEAIFQQVKSRIPGISFDTVYRTLSSFEEHKLIARVHHLDDKTRYDPNTKEHHHFVCIACKKIIDFNWPSFAALPLPPESYAFGHISQKYVEIRGTCSQCTKAAKTHTRR